jgi:subtilisin-like proprotein convertase family protein
VGSDADGDWVLNVIDTAAADTGSIRAFGLDVAGFTCD